MFHTGDIEGITSRKIIRTIDHDIPALHQGYSIPFIYTLVEDLDINFWTQCLRISRPSLITT